MGIFICLVTGRHFLQYPWERISTLAESVGQGKWVSPAGRQHMAVFALSYRKSSVGTKLPIFGVRKQPSHLLGPPLPVTKVRFSARMPEHLN